MAFPHTSDFLTALARQSSKKVVCESRRPARLLWIRNCLKTLRARQDGPSACPRFARRREPVTPAFGGQFFIQLNLGVGPRWTACAGVGNNGIEVIEGIEVVECCDENSLSGLMKSEKISGEFRSCRLTASIARMNWHALIPGRYAG